MQLFKGGKSPTEVAIKLDLNPQEANSLYLSYLSLNNLHHLVETFKQFENESLEDFINYYDSMKENGITKEEIVEAIKISNDYPIIKEEYHDMFNQLKEFKRQKEFYLSDNKLLILKNCELTNEHNSLVLKIESSNRLLQLNDHEINKKRDLLDTIKNSEDYTTLKNKIEEQINDFLNQKKDFFKLAITIILDIIKKDPKKEILINNILNSNENLESGFYLISYEEKIAETAANTISNIALELNTNNILNS